MRLLSTLSPVFLKYKKLYIAGFLITALANYLTVQNPQITGYIIDTISHKTTQRQSGFWTQLLKEALADYPMTRQISYAILIFIAITLTSGFFTFLMRQTIIVASRHIEYDLKKMLFSQYLRLDASFFDGNKVGDLMNRMSEDISRVRLFLGPGVMYLCNIVSICCLCFYQMFHTHAALTLICLSPTPVMVYLLLKMNKKITQSSQIIQADLSSITAIANESFKGIKIIQSFVQEPYYKRYFNQFIRRYKKEMTHLGKTEAIYGTATFCLIHSSILITLAAGSYFVVRQQLPVSVIVEFLFYINFMVYPLNMIGHVSRMYQKSKVSQKRISDFLDRQPSVTLSDTPVIFDAPVRSVCFQEVSFRYNTKGSLILNNLSVEINEGEKILMAGAIGCGKTTFCHLLLHRYNPNTGVIRINNHPLSQIADTTLIREISYVPQESLLLGQSVYQNITLGCHPLPSAERFSEALRLAHMTQEVAQMPQQEYSLLSELAHNLSGGQKQRIALARALARPFSFLLINDGLSAIDILKEKAIIEDLFQRYADKTILYISHRMTAPERYDRILLMDKGYIAEQGTHQALLAKRGAYYRLYQHQADKLHLEKR